MNISRLLFLILFIDLYILDQEAKIKENSVLDLEQENSYFQHNMQRHTQINKLKTKLNKLQIAMKNLKDLSATKLNQMKKIVDSNLFHKDKFKINVESLDLNI